MKKMLSVLLLCVVIISCHSQKISAQLKDKNKGDYFLGTWKLVERSYKEESKTKIFLLHKCMKEYGLLFKNENQKTMITKLFATGKDCEIKSKSDDFVITINTSSFFYMEYDLKKTEQYKIYSQNKFSVIYSDIIEGKVTEIEDIYQRKE